MRINSKYEGLVEMTEDKSLMLEMVASLCGDMIGQGCYRRVYEYALDPEKFVIKVEYPGNLGMNMNEYHLWDRINPVEWHNKWFAPCKWISPNGRVLVQRRADPLGSRSEKHLPDKLPSYFTDIKEENFGWIGDRFVCVDYATHTMLEKGMTKRMRKVDWGWGRWHTYKKG